MSSELVPFQRLAMSEVESVATKLAKSGLFADVKDANQAFVKILAGQELGIEPFQAMSGIHIIKGKPVLSADLLAKLVKRSGNADYEVVTLTDQVCELLFTVRGKQFTSSFSIADAQKAGIKSDMYAKYPRNMLFARALSNGVRWFCSDAVGGTLYIEGELEAEVKNITPQNPTPTQSICQRPGKDEVRSEKWKYWRTEWCNLSADDKATVANLYLKYTQIDIKIDTPEYTLDALEQCFDELKEMREFTVENQPEMSFGDELRIRYFAFGVKDRKKINDKYIELRPNGREPIQFLWKSDNMESLKAMEAALNWLNTGDLAMENAATNGGPMPSTDLHAVFLTLPLAKQDSIIAKYVEFANPDWPDAHKVWQSSNSDALTFMKEMIEVEVREA